MKKPQNEPIFDHAPGSNELADLQKSLDKFQKSVTHVPLIIGGQELEGSKKMKQVMPFDHNRTLAEYSWADEKQIKRAIKASMAAREQWMRAPLQERADVLLRAADLAAGKYRADLNATTMLGQAKTIIQAELDAACELVDFFRFNTYFALKAAEWQPISTDISTNSMSYRPLEGFVASVSPFNFSAIGGNLASCPALMGNGVLWKPSDTALLSNYVIYNLLKEAGMPDGSGTAPGVINFVPADGPVFGKTVTKSKHLACVNFTGSVPTFRWLWKAVAKNLESYETFPRLIGECGGKNFHFLDVSADLDTVAPQTIRSAFEYQGQKCSACSRMYVPKSIWPKLKEQMVEIAKQLKMGSPLDHSSFLSAVIDETAFDRIASYVHHAKQSSSMQLVHGGNVDKSTGYFIEPTIVECHDPKDRIMREEIFGPVIAVFPYEDKQRDKVLSKIKGATPYGLTGAVFSQDKNFLHYARSLLHDAVGNMYLNDKCTGSVVGQQPFGGARLSGTNDKAGGPHYALRFASPLTVKETSVPLKEWRYPSMG